MAGIFAVLGILIALLSPVEYETQAVVMPEFETTQSGAGDLLQQYGGMLGISGSDIGGMGSSSTIPPQLYPQIVEGIPYQMDLINASVTFQEYDTTATVYSFFNDIYTPSIFSYAKSYTIGLPGKVIGLFKTEEESNNVTSSDLQKLSLESIYTLNEDQKEILDGFIERISVAQDQESGVVTLTVEMPDPRAAAELGKEALALLKQYVREYRTQKAREDLEFIQQQVEQARQQFEESQEELTSFRDENLSLTSAKAQSREQELQSEYDLAFNTYNSLRQQREQAKITVQKNTPVFSILQPINQPLEKSEPQRKLIVIISLIMGTMIGAVWSLFRGNSVFFNQQHRISNAAK